MPDTPSLTEYSAREISCDGVARRVYVGGSGPAVIVMHEMPGLSAQFLRFARWLREAGFTTYLPSLFGEDLAEVTAEEGAAVLRRACVSAEFRALGGGQASPITAWLRGLARLAHGECGGGGVGAVGMCFTGNFALTMMLEPAVLAPVVAHPSLPLDAPMALEIAADELATIRRRLDTEDLTVRAYRFAGDRYCRAERFAAYAAALGTRFHETVLPDEAAGFDDAPPFFRAHVNFPHSVFTVHLVEREGSPTRQAVDDVIAFLRARLSTDRAHGTPDVDPHSAPAQP